MLGDQVVVKVGSVITEYALDNFIGNAGTSPKMVYNRSGILVWSPHNLFINSATPATQNVTLVTGAVYTVTVVGSGSLAGTVGASGTATEGSPATFTATGTSGTFTKTGTLTQIQINRGTVATAYLATGEAARFGIALDSDPTTLVPKGLLCEPAATNIGIRSQEFGLNWFKTQCVIADNNAIAPNGLMQADKITDDGLGGVSSVIGVSLAINVLAATVYTFSVYIKAGIDTTYALKTTNEAVPKWGLFNLSAQTFTPMGGGPTGTFQQLTNGWWRIAMTYTTDATDTAAGVVIGFQPNSTRDGTHSMWLWGAQLELGAIPTSHIPTFAATATRAADNYTFLLNTIPALGSAYSIYERFEVPIVNSGKYAVALTDGTINEIAGVKADAGATLSVVDGGAAQAAITIGTMSANTPVSAAVSVQANDVSGSVGGSAVTSDVTATLPTLDQARFGGAGDNNVATATFRIGKLAIVPRAWSDAELTTKSAT